MNKMADNYAVVVGWATHGDLSQLLGGTSHLDPGYFGWGHREKMSKLRRAYRAKTRRRKRRG